jgi:hypothetical protein
MNAMLLSFPPRQKARRRQHVSPVMETMEHRLVLSATLPLPHVAITVAEFRFEPIGGSVGSNSGPDVIVLPGGPLSPMDLVTIAQELQDTLDSRNDLSDAGNFELE